MINRIFNGVLLWLLMIFLGLLGMRFYTQPTHIFADIHPLVEQTEYILNHYRNASIKTADINIDELNEDS